MARSSYTRGEEETHLKKHPGVIATLLVIVFAAASSAQTLVVLNKAEATASLIDLKSGKVKATLATAEGPHEGATSPDGRMVVAAAYGTAQKRGSTLTLIDVATARVIKVINLEAGVAPHGLRFISPTTLLVTSETTKRLLIVDLERGAAVAGVETGQDLSHMVAATPDGKRAFVSSINSGTVTAIDVEKRTVLSVIATGAGAEGIDVSPDGASVWVVNRAADTVSVIDTTTLKIVATFESPKFPIRVKFTPDGRMALVSHAQSGDLAFVDAKTHAVMRTMTMNVTGNAEAGRLFQDFGKSPAPIGIVVTPDSRLAYVACANADVVAEVDLGKAVIVRWLKAGKEPDGMAYSPLTAGSGK